MDAIIKLHSDNYIRGVFFENIAPSDYDTQLRLAEGREFLKFLARRHSTS